MPAVAFGSFTIDASTRTPITVPSGCYEVRLTNGDLVNDCTLYDAAASGNSFPLKAGETRAFPFPTRGLGAGDTFCWAKADAGTGPIRAEYLT